MSSTVRCTLCADPDTWVPLTEVIDHVELFHSSGLDLARWPDGELMVFDEDELDAS